MIWEILFILLLILANGMFAAAEISFIAARKGRLEQRADEGNRNARRALELARNPDRFLPTVQIGITLVSALGAAYGGQQIVRDLSGWIAQLPWPLLNRHADGIGLGTLRRMLHLCFADPWRAGAEAHRAAPSRRYRHPRRADYAIHRHRWPAAGLADG